MKYGWLCLLAACGRYGFAGRADAAAGDATSGTRLEQTYNVYDDGFREPTQAPFDTLLGTKCDVVATTSGLRCIPTPAAFPRFADAGCTQPMAAKDTPDERYAVDTIYTPATRAYTFGASLGTPSANYELQYDGSCAALQAPTEEQFALDEITLDRFALLTPELGSEGRLVSQALVSDDGFRMPMPLHDTELDADCFGEVFDDATLCFPTPTDFAWYFANSTCSEPVEMAYVPVKFAQSSPTLQSCNSTDFTVQPLTTELPTTTPVWIGPPAATFCGATTVATGHRLFALGAPISLPAVTHQPHPGTRMQFVEDSANGATASTPFYIWDSQLGMRCSPGTAADGSQRCMPYALPYVAASYYKDAACTQPVTAAGVAAGMRVVSTAVCRR